MLSWMLVLLAGIGVLAGMLLRAPAMLLATAGIVASIAAASVMSGRPLSSASAWILASAATFQVAFLVGLAVVVWRRRQASRSGDKATWRSPARGKPRD